MFLESVSDLMYNKHVMRHSHITGEIIGYMHSFCISRVRGNKRNISVIAHNLFRFYFLLLLKGIRLSIWKISNLSTIRSNLTNTNFTNIGEQVKFNDTIYPQSLAKLAGTMVSEEK